MKKESARILNSTPTMSTAGTVLVNRPNNRAVKTCTECKQVKLRCDSKAKFPAPCTRCQSRNLQCVVDSAFRRTPARKRVEEMAKELEALRSQREASGQKSTMSPDQQFESPEYTLEQAGVALLNNSGLKEQYQLETFIINRETVVEIFELFCTFFYSHFPILNPNISISAVHGTSSLLFWTIIAIVTSRGLILRHEVLFQHLREPYIAQLRAEILSAPVPLQTIQALIHLIMFPLPSPRQSHDPSWLYCGAAMNAALYMGLHHSTPTQSLRSIGVPSGSLRARATTWLGCFLVSTSLGMHVGVSPSINGTTELATIETFVRSYQIPPEFAYQIMVQHTLARFTTVVLENSQEVVSNSLVKLIDTELDGLKVKYPVPWSPRVEMAVLIAKLHLYSMTIIRLQLDFTSREILMKSGYSVSLRIVYLLEQGLAYRSNDYPNLTIASIQRTVPKNYFRALVLAIVFLLRFFALNINAAPEEQEIARNHVAMAQRFLKAGSSKQGDEKSRAAFLLEILSRQTPIDIDNTKLRISDRMGASLVYDAITKGHELRDLNMDVEDDASPAEANQLEESENHEPMMNGVALPDNVMLGFDSYPEMPQIDLNSLDAFGGQLDISLSEDLWGDVWGMFGTFPQQL